MWVIGFCLEYQDAGGTGAIRVYYVICFAVLAVCYVLDFTRRDFYTNRSQGAGNMMPVLLLWSWTLVLGMWTWKLLHTASC